MHYHSFQIFRRAYCCCLPVSVSRVRCSHNYTCCRNMCLKTFKTISYLLSDSQVRADRKVVCNSQIAVFTERSQISATNCSIKVPRAHKGIAFPADRRGRWAVAGFACICGDTTAKAYINIESTVAVYAMGSADTPSANAAHIPAVIPRPRMLPQSALIWRPTPSPRLCSLGLSN